MSLVLTDYQILIYVLKNKHLIIYLNISFNNYNDFVINTLCLFL